MDSHPQPNQAPMDRGWKFALFGVLAIGFVMSSMHQYQSKMTNVQLHHSSVLDNATTALEKKLTLTNKKETSGLKNEISTLQNKLASLSKNHTEELTALEKRMNATNKKETSGLKNEIKTFQNRLASLSKTKQLTKQPTKQPTKPCKKQSAYQCQPGQGAPFKVLASGDTGGNKAGCADFCDITLRCLAFDFNSDSKSCRLYATTDRPRLGTKPSSQWCVKTVAVTDTSTKLRGTKLPPCVKTVAVPHTVSTSPETQKCNPTLLGNFIKLRNGKNNFVNWKPVSFKTCAVVGSGASLLGSNCGASIDATDAVFRINGAPTLGFEKDVGSVKTFDVTYSPFCARETQPGLTNTICVHGGGGGAEMGLFNRMKADVQLHYKRYKFWKFWNSWTKMKHPDELHFYQHLTMKALSNYNMKVGVGAPTSGFAAIVSAFDMCDSVDIYGFDLLFGKNYKRVHYYDFADTDYNPSITPHSFTQEGVLLKQYIIAKDATSKNAHPRV